MNLQKIQVQSAEMLLHIRENNGRLSQMVDRLNYNLSSPDRKPDSDVKEKSLSKGLILDIDDISNDIQVELHTNTRLLSKLESILYHYDQNEETLSEMPAYNTSKQILKG